MNKMLAQEIEDCAKLICIISAGHVNQTNAAVNLIVILRHFFSHSSYIEL